MKIDKCRICGGTDLRPVLDLGYTPLADDFLTAERLNEPEIYYPLRVVVCGDPTCRLVQLDYTVDRSTLYSPDYPYLSSTTVTGRAHYEAMAASIVTRFDTHGKLAVDIGSNVGVLLGGFRKAGNMQVLGVEPVKPIAERASASGIPTIHEFFSEQLADEILQFESSDAAVITGTNVVAHIHDLHDLARGIRHLLAPKGVFVFEAPHLDALIAKHAYDTIYHEHLSYLTALPINRLFAAYGMRVFDIEPQPIHGGTLRYYIARVGDYPVSDAVTRQVEQDLALTDRDLHCFSLKVRWNILDLQRRLLNLRDTGRRIAAVSAPAKGMTLLNVCGIGTSTLEFVTEKSETKIGRFTPGTHVKVVRDSELVSEIREIDYALLLAWNFAGEIIANNREFVARGGRFIIPIGEKGIEVRP